MMTRMNELIFLVERTDAMLAIQEWRGAEQYGKWCVYLFLQSIYEPQFNTTWKYFYQQHTYRWRFDSAYPCLFGDWSDFVYVSQSILKFFVSWLKYRCFWRRNEFSFWLNHCGYLVCLCDIHMKHEVFRSKELYAIFVSLFHQNLHKVDAAFSLTLFLRTCIK